MAGTIRIIAWGNVGRQDDGVALVLAERLERHYANDPRVIVQQYHQLGPELVEDLHRCEVAIFLDAHLQPGSRAVTAEPVVPATEGGLDTHHCSPQALLGLTAALGLRVPQAWFIGIGGHQWDFGDALSEATRQAMLDAERVVHDLVATVPASCS